MKERKVEFLQDFSNSIGYAIGSFGRYGSGKSRLGVTGPDITGIIPIDKKTRRTVETVMKEMGKVYGRNILMPPENFIEYVNPFKAEAMEEEEAKRFYQERVDRIKDVAHSLLNNKDVRLIVFDTFEEYYKNMLYAFYGKKGSKFKKTDKDRTYQDRSEANTDCHDLIRALSAKPLLLTNTSKEEWYKDKVTGRDIWDGFKNLGYSCEAMIEHQSNSSYIPDDENTGWKFRLNVRGCQANFILQGPEGNPLLEDDMITFANLAMAVFPESDPEMFI